MGALAGAAREASRHGGFSAAPVLQPRQCRCPSTPDGAGDHRADPGRMRRRGRQRRRERAGRWSASARDSPISVARSPPFAARPVTGLGARRRRVLFLQRPDSRRRRRSVGDLRGVSRGVGLVELDISDDEALDVAPPDPQGLPRRAQLGLEFPRSHDGRRAPRARAPASLPCFPTGWSDISRPSCSARARPRRAESRKAGLYRRGATAAATLLPGFSIAVSAVFDAD